MLKNGRTYFKNIAMFTNTGKTEQKNSASKLTSKLPFHSKRVELSNFRVSASTCGPSIPERKIWAKLWHILPDFAAIISPVHKVDVREDTHH